MFLKLLLVGSVLMAAFGSAQGEPTAEPLDPAGLIAFIDLDGRPAVLDAASGEVQNFALGAMQRGQFPAWSRAGTALAVIVSDLGGGRVVHIDVVSGEVQLIYRPLDRAPIYLGFAPDDRTLAVLASRLTVPGLALDLIDVARAVGGEAHSAPPFAFGAPFYWDWIALEGGAPPRMLVHQNVLSPQRRAGVSDLDAFALRVEFPTPGAFQSPSAAPDGRHLAYASLEGDARSVVLLSYDAQRNEAEVRARFTHQGVAALSWRPDGSALLLQSPPVPSPHSFGPLELLELDGGRRTLSEDNVVAAWWSPDGRFVATLSPVSGGAPRTVFGATDGAELQWLAAFDAERVQQGRPPLLSLKLIDVDAGQTTPLSLLTPSPLFYGQYLPFFDQYSRSHRLWSPESDALALPILDEAGVSTVVRFGIDGSVTPLVQGDMPTWNWR